MVILPVELHQFCSKVQADSSKDAAQVVQNGFREHVAPVFRYEDQVDMQVKNTMSSMSYVSCLCHAPSVQWNHVATQSCSLPTGTVIGTRTPPVPRGRLRALRLEPGIGYSEILSATRLRHPVLRGTGEMPDHMAEQ